MARHIYIYGLVDPRNHEEVRYVGWTVNPRRRLQGHIEEAKKGGSCYRVRWIRTLLTSGLEPQLIVLEEGLLDYRQVEPYWIHLARALGHRLTNATPGGDGLGPGPRSPEIRASIAAANSRPERRAQERSRMLAKWQDEEWRAFVLASRTGIPNSGQFQKGFTPANKGKKGPPAWNKGKKGVSEETRAKLSAAKKGKAPHNKGKRISVATRKKISESVRLAMASPAVQARYRRGLANRDLTGEKHPMHGKHHTEETRARISASRKGQLVGDANPFYGKKHSPNPFYGKKHSPESLAKISKGVFQGTKVLTCPHCDKLIHGAGNLTQHVRAKHPRPT